MATRTALAGETRTLELRPATREAVAGMGELISIEDDDATLPTAFYEGTVRVYTPSTFVSDEDTHITLCSIDRRPASVTWMERHFKHTQVFIPLAGKPFVMVLAPPTPDGDAPDLDSAQAFLFDGSAGFQLAIGTWHEFPFALVDDTQVVVILRSEATKNLLKDASDGGEAHGPDLDKKNIVARTGVTLEWRV